MTNITIYDTEAERLNEALQQDCPCEWKIEKGA